MGELPGRGLEPPPTCVDMALNHARLPIPPPGRGDGDATQRGAECQCSGALGGPEKADALRAQLPGEREVR